MIRITLLVNGAIGLALAIPGIRFLFPSPRRTRDRSSFLRIIPLDSLASGVPFRQTVMSDRHDAFTHYPPGPVGSVWLIREDRPNQSSKDDEAIEGPLVRCFQTICPHLGCGIEFAKDRSLFTCRCHTSDFELNGTRLLGPSPRGMDELVCRVTDPDDSGKRWVEISYQEFKTGVEDRRPIA